ncbi:MAG: hypothetical protein AAFU60_00505 [Bacteroidota bacterium]
MTILWACHLGATTYFVHAHGNGDGISWSSASNDLSGILAACQAGDQVWVAAGTYHPTTGTDRQASFIIPNGVAVYGGFVGFEQQLNERNIAANQTILSGEIGAPGIQDNSFSVIYTEGVDASTQLNGFVISHGNANGKGEEGNPTRCGGGWFNQGAQGQASNPTIQNCIFRNNSGRDGAAFYSNGSAGISNPVFSACQFIANQADLDGGAIYVNAQDHGQSILTMEACLFDENMASYGAGVFAKKGSGQCKLLINNCTFQNNTAFLWGGGVYNIAANGSPFDLNIEENCKFSENYPSDINKQVYLANKE